MKKYFYLSVLVSFVFGLFLFNNVVKATTENITQINFTTLPQSINANTISGILTVETQNISGVEEPLDTSGTVLNLTSSSATGEFSNSNTNWIPVLTLGMNKTWAHRNFYYRDSTPGTYTFTVSAQDKNWTPATQTIIINGTTTGDTTPPTLNLPADITVEATSSSGAIVNYTVTADDVDPVHPIVTCTPNSDTTFPIGTTVVACSTTDTAGNTTTGNFNIIVKDFIEITPSQIITKKHGGYRILPPNILNVPNTALIEKILSGENGQVLGTEKYNFSQDLFFGVKNNEVKELQKFLISKGFLRPGTLGGYFGIRTQNALKEYQKTNSLWTDGIVGPQTRAMLNR